MTSTKIGQLFSLAYTKPLSAIASSGAVVVPGALMYFYVSGSSYATLQNAYVDSGLTTAAANPITADAYGRFAPVYFNPALQYGVKITNASGTTLELCDPANVQNTSLPVQLFKASTTSRASTTALATDPDLTYAITIPGTYKIELDLYPAAASGTSTFAMSVEYSGSLVAAAGNNFAIVGAFNNVEVTAAQAVVAVNGSINGTVGVDNSYLRVAGTIQVSTAGTLALYWAQNVSSATATTLIQGSAMAVTQIG